MMTDSRADRQASFAETAEELWRLELALIVPAGHDLEELTQHIAPDFHEIGASGRRLSYDQAVDAVRSRGSATAVEVQADLSRVSMELLSAEVVLLTYDLRTPTRRTRRSSIWQQRDQRWVMVFHQGTVDPEEVQP